MRKTILLITYMLCFSIISIKALNQPSSMKLKEGLKIQNFGQKSKIKFICQARVGQCKFSYLILPPQWGPSDNDLIIPTADINSIKSFVVQAEISEPTGESMKRNIIIDFEDGTGKVKSQLLSFDDGRVQKPASESFVSATNRNKNEFGQTFFQANGILPSLPTIARLDQIIVQGDTFTMTTTIQNIIQYEQNCSNKVQYINQITKRIQEHLQFNKNRLSEQKGKVLKNKQDLNTLSQQKRKLEEELQKYSNKKSLEDEVRELSILQNDYNSKYFLNNAIANQYLLKFKALVGSERVETSTIDVERQLDSDKKQLKEVLEEIQELISLKNSLQSRIKDNENKLKQTTVTNISQASSENISALQNKVKEYSAIAAEYKQKGKQISEKLSQIKFNLNNVVEKTTNLTSSLNNIDTQLKSQTTQSLSQEMQTLQNRIETLQKNIPKLQNQITKCQHHNELNKNRPTAIIYSISSKTQEHNNKIISQAPSLEVMNVVRKTSGVKMPINIFSSSWIRNYGVPSISNFKCTNIGRSEEGFGVITNIVKGSISVRDYLGNNYLLQISFCSRMQGKSSSFAPKIGDKIDWRGKKKSFNAYNAFRIVFY